MECLALHAILGLCVAGITQFRAGCDKQLFVRGSMGLVAGEASLPLNHRVMFGDFRRRLFLVTLQAEVVPVLAEEFHILTGMGVVAGKTLSGLEWLVLNGSAGQYGFGVVTLVTEFPPFLGNRERLRRGGGVMAAVASHRGHRVMGGCLQELWLLRRMRIVADGAFPGFNRIVSVSLLEGCSLAVVTFKA